LALRNSHGTFYYRNESARAPGDASAQSLHGSSKGEERETWFDAVGRASARIVALSEVKEQHANVSPVPWSASVLKMIEAERFADALAEVAKAPVHADLATRGVFSAMLHLQMDHLDAAEQECQALAADFPRDPRAFFLLGLIQERRELSAAATALHQRAIDLAPTFAMPHLHLARLARRRDDLGTATHHFRQAVGWLPAEDAEWILLFGGGFGRSALERMCRAELEALAGEPGAAP
jgi:chemotaxis protein methyltransferase CheR